MANDAIPAFALDEDPNAILRELLAEVRKLRREVRSANGGVLSHEEAAEYLGISSRNLYYIVRHGKMKRVTLSQNRFGFRREELDRYVSEHEEVLCCVFRRLRRVNPKEGAG